VSLEFSEGNSEKSYLGGVEIFFPAWAIIYICWRTTDWELSSFSQVFPLSLLAGESIAEPPVMFGTGLALPA
jgi:hypothetical protein